jgi:hypothetical protein
MYLLSETEYELEAEDFGDEIVTEEEIKEPIINLTKNE